MVEVSAFDKNSGERNEIVIQNNDGLSTQDVEAIKSRMDRNEEPDQIQGPKIQENTYKHPAEERLQELQKMLEQNQENSEANH